MVRIPLVATALFLSLAGLALAAPRLEIKMGNVLTVLGEAPSDCYLGVSLFPPGAPGATRTGRHSVRQVTRGGLEEFTDIPAGFRGGTYEVALWRRQVGLSSCRTANCQWCARNGFHMEGLLAYRSGTIPAR